MVFGRACGEHSLSEAGGIKIYLEKFWEKKGGASSGTPGRRGAKPDRLMGGRVEVLQERPRLSHWHGRELKPI